MGDTIGRAVALEDRHYVLNIKTYSFIIDLSQCPRKEFYITITGEQDNKENHILPTTGLISWNSLYSMQMATSGFKAVFAGINSTWSVIQYFMYTYTHRALGRSNREEYVIITDIFTLHYRGECEETLDSITLTVDPVQHRPGNFKITRNSIRWFWPVMPRQPNSLVWKISYKNPTNMFIFPHMELERRTLSQSPQPHACDILMSILRDTDTPFFSECGLKHGFFKLETGKCYHVQQQSNQTWKEAAAYCKNRGAVLASIDNANEMYLLQRVFETLNSNHDVMIYGHVLYIGIHRHVSIAIWCNTRILIDYLNIFD